MVMTSYTQNTFVKMLFISSHIFFLIMIIKRSTWWMIAVVAGGAIGPNSIFTNGNARHLTAFTVVERHFEQFNGFAAMKPRCYTASTSPLEIFTRSNCLSLS